MATEDYYLDRDQLQHLNSDLTTLIEHVFDVENVLTRQTCYGKLPGHRADRPLPYSEKASELLRGLAYGLPAICGAAGYTTRLYGQDAVIECLHWLRGNPMRLASYEDAMECADDIHHWARQIVFLVDRPRYPDFIGLCPKCGEPIYSYTSTGEITCMCGGILDVAVLKASCVEMLEREYFTRRELRSYLTERGVPRRTQNRWLNEISSVDYGGRSYWLMGDVVEKLRERLRGCNA